jgi:hypothetical protein
MVERFAVSGDARETQRSELRSRRPTIPLESARIAEQQRASPFGGPRGREGLVLLVFQTAGEGTRRPAEGRSLEESSRASATAALAPSRCTLD